MKPSPFMARALDLARAAADLGEVPVGAVLVRGDEILAEAHNRTEADHDPTAHAEILVLRAAGRVLASPRLIGCDLYVTLEPCPMCAAAISAARLRRLYFGAFDPKSGGVDHGPRIFKSSACHHAPDIYGGIAELESAALLRRFFEERRG